AGMMSVSPALVRFTYPQQMLGRAISINALTVATSAALGPTMASAVLAVASWPWLFGINVPVGAAALLIGMRTLPRTASLPRRLNQPGGSLNAGTVILLVCGIQASAHHAAEPLALIELVAAGVLGFALVRHELPRAAPIIPFDLLKIRLFSLSIAT